jgi:WD40 repeat protein
VPNTHTMKLTLSDSRHLGVSFRHAFSDPNSFPPDAPAPDTRVNSLAYAGDGSALFCATNDGVLGVLHTGGEAVKVSEFYVRESGCRLVTATHHASGVLHAAAHGGGIAYHNLHENKLMRKFQGHQARITSLSMSPISDAFLTLGADGRFLMWDLRTSQHVAQGRLTLPEPVVNMEPPNAMGCFDSSGKVFAIATPDRGLSLYDARMTAQHFTAAPFKTLVAPMAQYLTHPVVRVFLRTPCIARAPCLTTTPAPAAPPWHGAECHPAALPHAHVLRVAELFARRQENLVRHGRQGRARGGRL